MSEQNAAITAKSMVHVSMTPHEINDGMAANAPDLSYRTSSQIAAEYWARRAMWLLVIATSLWDIAITFDQHLGLPGLRLARALTSL